MKISIDTPNELELENLHRCIEEFPDPIGARNWSPNSSVIEEIKKMHTTDRISRIRDRYLSSRQQLYIKDRGQLVTESYKSTIGEDPNIRQAKSLAHVLENYPIYIRDDELIVGSITPTPRGSLWFPEFTDWLVSEIDTISTRQYNPFFVADEDKEYYLNVLHPYWENRCSFSRIMKQCPDEVNEKIKYGLWSNGIAHQGHIGHLLVLDKHRLSRGLRWYKERAQHLIDTTDYHDPKYIDKYQFWKSVIIICDAIHTFALRHAAEAARLASLESDPKRRAELEKISEICTKVPWNAPESFHEAVQSAWFYQLIYYYETNVPAQSPGRVDQKLYEWFKPDVIDNKTISLEEAEDILACYWMKIAETNKVYTEMESRFRTGNPMFQNIALGGTDRHGNSAVNELSYLCLKVEEMVHLDQPNTAVIVDDSVPDDFINEAVKVLRRGGGKPMFLGAKSRVEYFKKAFGYPEEIARSYDSVCCSFLWNQYQPNFDHAADVIPGMALEYVFTNGKDRKTGVQVGPVTGNPELFTSVEDIFNAWVEQMKFAIKMTCLHANAIYKVWQDFLRVPYTSMFNGTCLTDGMDITCGGSCGHPAAYAPSIGMVNVIDSLAAIQQVVFDGKKATMNDVVDALDKNFDGYELLRKWLLEAPKYGTDNELADQWIPRIQQMMNDEYIKHPMRFGRLRKQLVLQHLSAGVLYGDMMGATPDGRKAHEPLAEGGISPMQGLPLKGPTASMRSAAKWDYTELLSVVYNQKFHPRALQTEEDVAKLSALVRAFMCNMGENGLGGAHLQINVVSAETLRDAQEHPENYSDLIIRVAGYTAFFTEISRDLQDDLIARVEFEEAN